jgi:hypothetical protein
MTKGFTAFFLALLLVSCGGDSTDDPGPDGALFRIDSEGGFAPIDWILRRGPLYTLTSDGRLISEGPVPAIFPGPLVTPYWVTQLTDGEMRQIREMIDGMGLAEMVEESDDSNADFIADATTEVITYWDADGTHRYSVYALGLEGDRQPSRPATRVFAELRIVLDTIAFSGRAQTPYQPDQIRVIAGEGMIDPEFTDIRDWPFPDTDLGDFDRVDDTWWCLAFDASALGPFIDATQATMWRNPVPGEHPAEIQLLVRALHPGEDDCPTRAPVGG